MASLLDSPVAFFTKATPEQFAFVLGQYREIFKVHAQETRGAKKNGPAELIKLDNWYQDTLPQLIKSRKEKQLLYDEIVQITKWKLLRGKFRPSILDLVRTNTETAIKNITKKAFKKMPNINAAITALTQLKGIAPATASAILVAHSPDLCCYMSEENMASTPGVEESDLSISEYLNYVEQTNLCVERLKAQDPKTNWRSHDVELAIWTLYQAKQYNSNLLDNMPTGKKSDTNGKLEDNHEEEENIEKNNLNEDEGVNSDRSDRSEDENSNHSNNSNNSNSSNNSQQSNQSIEQNESNEMNIDSQLNNNKTNGHSNGSNLNEESNLTSASSEYEDKSNDSLLNNNSNDEENVQNLENKEPEITSTEQMNVESSLQSNEQQNVDNQSNNQMEIVKTNDEIATNGNHLTPIINNEDELIKKTENEKIVENLNNHHINNNEIINNNLENKLEELKEKSNIINNLEINNHHLSNGTIKNGINIVFDNEKLNNKETLISSSEDNSNNLSEENSNSNLSYSDHNNLDLHSTDNALDDQPALKRIRVE